MMRVGVIGSLVWDTIYPYHGDAGPGGATTLEIDSGLVEEWGGIGYALSALTAIRPEGWEIVPIIKIGREMEESARSLLEEMPGLDLGAIEVVSEPNYRVELRYFERERRTERLRGGIPPWSWEEVEPHLRGLDALYINFITGFELDLRTATEIRASFEGPVYADLHSLFLGIDQAGLRTLRRLADWQEWLRSFDIVQLNEDELRWLSGGVGDPWHCLSEVSGDELGLMFVTLGSRGAAYLEFDTAGSMVTGRVATTEVVEGDPTGCGDVWGATAFVHLLSGSDVGTAMQRANQVAAHSARFRGTAGLYEFLQGCIAR